MVSGKFSRMRLHASDASFRRLGSKRYALVYDLHDVPRGGFCAWRLTGFGVAARRAGVAHTGSAVMVMSLDYPPDTGMLPLERLRPQSAEEETRVSHCTRERLVECTTLSQKVAPFEGEGTFHLNVRWAEEDGHE